MTDPILERFREALERDRAAGATFQEAWDVAIIAVPASDSTGDPCWRGILRATAEAWRDAFEGRPASPAVRACAAVAFDPDRGPLNECALCGGPLPDARSDRRYCSVACRRRANRPRLIAA